jgi:hypothetical protein
MKPSRVGSILVPLTLGFAAGNAHAVVVSERALVGIARELESDDAEVVASARDVMRALGDGRCFAMAIEDLDRQLERDDEGGVVAACTALRALASRHALDGPWDALRVDEGARGGHEQLRRLVPRLRAWVEQRLERRRALPAQLRLPTYV